MNRSPMPSSEAQPPKGRRIGVFGGTFDPPHIANLILAERVRDEMALDEVRFVVANHPWQKEGSRHITRAEDRLNMVRDALGQSTNLVLSRVELDAGGPSFTIDTLRTFSLAEPATEWFVIVGADAAQGLDTWHEAEALQRMAHVVVVNRPAIDRSSGLPAGWRISEVEIPWIGISSSDLRSRVRAGRSIRYLTPDAVVARVANLGIYRQDS